MLPILTIVALHLGAFGPVASARVVQDTTRAITQYKVEQWTDANGLPQNSIWALAQTPDRFLWIATEQGLIRFDGEIFEVFDPSNTPAFARSQMLALTVAPDSTLWIGTAGSGVVAYRRGVFRAFPTPAGEALKYVQAVAVDEAGDVWAGSSGGLLHIERSGRVSVLNRSTGLPDDEVTSVATDRGVVWAGTKSGLVRIENGVVRVFGASSGLAESYVRSLRPARGGGVWIGTNGDGVFHFDGETFRALDARLARQAVFSMVEDAAGTLWIGTNGNGLHRWSNGELETLSESNGGSDLVWALLNDADERLWIGTNGRGLIQLSEAPFVPLGEVEGLSGDVTLAVLQARNGDRWIGTAGAGLNRITPNGAITRFNTSNGLAARLILSLAELPNGDILIGSQNGSITRYRNGRMIDETAAHGLHESVMAILPDRAGAYWVGTSGGGMHHYSAGRHTTLTANDGLASDFIKTLYRARSGAIWVGTREGLSVVVDGRVQRIEEEAKLHRVSYVAFYESGDGSVWSATQGKGIARITNGKVSYLDSSAGLCDDIVHALVDDGAGNLWFSSNRGISRAPLNDLHAYFAGRETRVRCTQYNVADGMRSREANGGFTPASARLQDGRIMFPTMGGLVTFDPGAIRSAPPASLVVLQYAVVGQDTIALEARREVTVAGADRNLAIRFTAPSYRGAERVRYRFKLDGFDKEWLDAGSRKVAFYTNLPPGDYVFRVLSANEHGVWSETPGTLRVVVPPRFYETWWFYTLSALSLVLLILALHRLRVSSVEKNAAHLAALVRERTRAEERYRDLLENASDIVIICDAQGAIISWNAEAERLIGYTKDEAIGTPISAILLEFGSFSNLARRDIHFTRRNGEPATIEITTRRIIDHEQVVGYQVFGRDVYEWRRMQAQLEQAQKMEAVGRLAGGIAHDFNNLLTVIRGNSELIGNATQPEVREIIKAADSAASLTQQLLAFSRKQVQQTRALDLNLEICNARSLLERLIGEDVELVTALNDELPPIRGDRSQVEQIIMNLVLNARDAMPNGGQIFVGTRPYTIAADGESAEWETEPGPYVELCIRDTGTGMDQATRARIFEPFFTTKEPGHGTGLGLATVYGVVKQTGGHIIVESEPGEGTEVRVYLPVASSDLVEVARPAAPARQVSCTPAGGRILLVEDEDAVRNLTRKVLVRHGFNVTTAAGGPEALQLLEQIGTIDLLLTDIVMPVMNGRELARKIHDLHPDIRILYMSGYTEDEVIRRGVLPEGEQYLGKPFTPAGLVEAVADALAGK